jgi:hypothetical protein
MFISIMKYEDFIHMSVPGDGACFFHSLTAILGLEGDPIPSDQTMKQTDKNRNALAKKLRKECVDWLEKNLDYKIAQIGMTIRDEIEEAVRYCVNHESCDNYKTVKEYLTYMRKNKAYAGQIEIYAMSYYLGRSIRVFIRDRGKFKSAGLGFMIGLKPDPLDDIHIYHNIGESSGNNEHHFEPLYPKVKAKKEIKKKKESNKSPSKARRSKARRSKARRRKASRRKASRRKASRRKASRRKASRRKASRRKASRKAKSVRNNRRTKRE